MTADEIQGALADITAEEDPTLKHLKLASVISALFRDRAIELVVVGGSAIEFYTEGAYASGDLDMCLISPARVDLRTRQELMGRLGARGGPRTWQEARRLAEQPEYGILPELTAIVSEVADELATPSPYHS